MIDDLLAEAREALKTVSDLRTEYALQVQKDGQWFFATYEFNLTSSPSEANWDDEVRDWTLDWPGRDTRIVRRQVSRWEVAE